MIMAVLFAVLFGAIFFGIPICFSLAMVILGRAQYF